MALRWIIFCLYLIGSVALATPSTVILMRHAEKPTSGDEGSELSARGWERSAALPLLFRRNSELILRAPPAALFAAAPKRDGGSIRSIQTLKFLSKAYALPINTNFDKNEGKRLVKYILSSPDLDGKVVVIAWQHDNITELAQRFGYDKAKSWSGKIFDRLWLLDFKNDELVRFLDLPEHLLPGDSVK